MLFVHLGENKALQAPRRYGLLRGGASRTLRLGRMARGRWMRRNLLRAAPFPGWHKCTARAVARRSRTSNPYGFNGFDLPFSCVFVFVFVFGGLRSGRGLASPQSTPQKESMTSRWTLFFFFFLFICTME
jgi:hypothetical protein